MARAALEGITVLADDVERLATFFEQGLGLEVAVREEHYVALATPGVRLAIFRRGLMAANTENHPSFRGPRSAQAFELNFECAAPEEVDSTYRTLLAHGAAPVREPRRTEWGHFTAFFADPERNIHSLFAVLRD